MPASTTPPAAEAPPAEAPAPQAATRRRRAVVGLVCRLLILIATLAAVGGEVDHALETTSSLRSIGAGPSAVADERQTSCWAAEVRHLVPRGSRVYVGSGTVASQRLAEALALWAEPTSDARAPLSLALQPAPAGTCGGVTVAVSNR